LIRKVKKKSCARLWDIFVNRNNRGGEVADRFLATIDRISNLLTSFATIWAAAPSAFLPCHFAAILVRGENQLFNQLARIERDRMPFLAELPLFSLLFSGFDL